MVTYEADWGKWGDTKHLTSMARLIMETQARRLRNQKEGELFANRGILEMYEATSLGNIDAIYYLGYYYELIEKDKEKARNKYMQVAKYGNKEAMKRLSPWVQKW